jgi:hypothetical protein
MEKILTIEELKASASKLSVGQVNEALRQIGVRIGYDRAGREWFGDFCKDHPAFEAGSQGTRSFQESKVDAIDAALASAAWYRRYVGFTSVMDLAA